MKKNRNKIKTAPQLTLQVGPTKNTLQKRDGLQKLIREAIFLSKNGSSQKDIASWIKERHNVGLKFFKNQLKKTLKRLVKLKYVYVQQVKPKRYKLTEKGEVLKQAMKTRLKLKKKKRRNNKKIALASMPSGIQPHRKKIWHEFLKKNCHQQNKNSQKQAKFH